MQMISQFIFAEREMSVAEWETYRFVGWKHFWLQNLSASEQNYTADTTTDLDSSTFLDSSVVARDSSRSHQPPQLLLQTLIP